MESIPFPSRCNAGHLVDGGNVFRPEKGHQRGSPLCRACWETRKWALSDDHPYGRGRVPLKKYRLHADAVYKSLTGQEPRP